MMSQNGYKIPSRAIVAIHLFDEGLAYTTRRLARATYLGDPVNLVRQFQDFGAHEIVIVDVAASRCPSDRRPKLLERIAGAAVRPLSYVGGVLAAGEAKEIIELGYERIGLGSLLLERATAVETIVESLGAQSVFSFVDYFGEGHNAQVWTARGGLSGVSLVRAAIMAAEAGVGEIVLRSASRDGGLGGLDTLTPSEIAKVIDVPLVSGGGLRSCELDEVTGGPWSLLGGTVFSLFRSAAAPMPHFLP